MGFGTVVANMIFFIAILTLSAGFVAYMHVYASETSNSLNRQQERISDEIRTNMNIDDASYNDSTNTVTIYSRNNGETNIPLNAISVHIANERIASSAFTVSIEPDTLLGSEQIWQPGEVIRIQATKPLTSGNHQIRIIAPNGVTATDRLVV